MKCPYCFKADTRVIDSRSFDEGIRRRRLCPGCHARFSTYERIQNRALFVIKKDGRREGFSREKVLSGVRKACEKRPLPTGAIDKLVDDIEAELYKLGKPELPSSLIGDIVMDRLQLLDQIAYIRFASVYREFADIGTLKQAVDILLESETRGGRHSSQLPLLSRDELKTLYRRRKREV